MKLFHTLTCQAALSGMVLATAASASPEQWLQYHTSDQGRSYRWLELSSPPPSVALPELTGQPYFARWATPLDPTGGRWICFDRSRRHGPCNRVIADLNGNGRLDDDAAVDAFRTSEYSAEFPPLRFVFKGEDGRLTYHLLLRFLKYDGDDMRAMAMSGCYYEGNVDLGGKKRLVRLIDGNVNGLFNDIDLNPAECDRIAVDGGTAGELFLGRLLEVDEQLFEIAAARDGAFVKVGKLPNPRLGQVRLPENISELTAVGTSGHFVRKPVKGELKLPVGRYRVHGWVIDRKDETGTAWKLIGSGAAGDCDNFDVSMENPVKLEIGEPVRPALTVVENKSGANFSLRLKGRLGESIEIQKGGQQPRAPQLVLANAAGFRATYTFEYG